MGTKKMISIVASALALYTASAQTSSTAAPAGSVFIPGIQLPGLGMPSMVLECNTPFDIPPPGTTCAGTLKEFTNPFNEFKVQCSTGGCAETDFQFNYDEKYYGERIHSMVFSEAYAGYRSTVTVDNRSPYGIYIDNLECKGVGACQDMTIKLIGATMNDLHCEHQVGACIGCTIEICKRQPGPTGAEQIVCGPKNSCQRP